MKNENRKIHNRSICIRDELWWLTDFFQHHTAIDESAKRGVNIHCASGCFRRPIAAAESDAAIPDLPFDSRLWLRHEIFCAVDSRLPAVFDDHGERQQRRSGFCADHSYRNQHWEADLLL